MAPLFVIISVMLIALLIVGGVTYVELHYSAEPQPARRTSIPYTTQPVQTLAHPGPPGSTMPPATEPPATKAPRAILNTPAPYTNEPEATGQPRADGTDRALREFHSCLQSDATLQAAFIADFAGSHFSDKQIQLMVHDENTFVAIFKLAFADDEFTQELAEPFFELMEIQCRYFRDNPDQNPWSGDDPYGDSTQRPQTPEPVDIQTF